MRKAITTAALAAIVATAGPSLAGEPDPVCGDVNDSGTVSSTDALLVLRRSVSQPIALDCSAYDERFSASEASLAAANADLAICNSNLSDSQSDLTACQDDVATCGSDLETCQGQLAACGNGCDAPLSCPAPADGNHQTVCGQLFDLEDGSKFQATDSAGTKCTTPTVDGPCSLNIRAYDALAFSMDPTGTPPLTSGPVYIDDCGRYRLPDIAIPAGGFLELVIDDAGAPQSGPTGSTNTVGVTTPKQAGAAVPNVDGWVASKETTDLWEESGGEPVSGGLYIPIFYERVDRTNRDLQDGVTVTKSGSAITQQDDYFVATELARQTIDPAATKTGINGTALVTGASVSDGLVYSGTGGGLSESCQWETHAGASLPFILTIQAFRPRDAIGQTCDR